MSRYNLEARYFVLENLRRLDDTLIDQLWQLYTQICAFWQTCEDPSGARQELLSFVSNRIEVDIRYLAEYVNYGTVIEELINELGTSAAYKRLFIDASGNLIPPITNFGRAKQFVVNEFIALSLALGGFKVFGDMTVPQGSPLNYPGFIGGMCLENHTPYRTT
jgi:hypothetical protein